MSAWQQTPSQTEVRTTFGARFWVSSGSAAEYMMNPAFLPFLAICIGIHAIIEEADMVFPLLAWQYALLWLAEALACLVAFVLVRGLLGGFQALSGIGFHYLPLIYVPIVAINECTAQLVFIAFGQDAFDPLSRVLVSFLRELIFIMFCDLLHFHYVVPAHPQASTTRPGDAAPAAAAAPATDPAARSATPEAAPGDTPLILLADRSVPITEILYLQSGDHYLTVVTTGGRFTLRAKLSDVAALQDDRFGMQVNRSQWVAFTAIQSMSDEPNGQIALRLADGSTATVSRSRRLIFLQAQSMTADRA